MLMNLKIRLEIDGFLKINGYEFDRSLCGKIFSKD